MATPKFLDISPVHTSLFCLLSTSSFFTRLIILPQRYGLDTWMFSEALYRITQSLIVNPTSVYICIFLHLHSLTGTLCPRHLELLLVPETVPSVCEPVLQNVLFSCSRASPDHQDRFPVKAWLVYSPTQEALRLTSFHTPVTWVYIHIPVEWFTEVT